MNTENYFFRIVRVNCPMIPYTFQTHFHKPTCVVDIVMRFVVVNTCATAKTCLFCQRV